MKKQDIAATIKGLSPIMFDRFYDQSKTERAPRDKLYLSENMIVLPSANLWAFFTCQRTGCAKMFEGKPWMDYYRSCQSFLRIQEADILPLFDDKDKPIEFDDFEKKTYVYIANVLVGSGQKKSRMTIARPVVRMPWHLKFNMILFENKLITVKKLEEWLRIGGTLVALGNGRPRFGRFELNEWEVK